MSDLQIVLIIIGGLIILAVLIFNWWQERRFHQQVDTNFSAIKTDALLEKTSLESEGNAHLDPELDEQDFSINHDAIDDTVLRASEPALSSINQMDAPVLDAESRDFAPSTHEPAVSAAINDTFDTDTDSISPDSTAHSPAIEVSKTVASAEQEHIKTIIQEAFSTKPDAEHSYRAEAMSTHTPLPDTPIADSTAQESTPFALPDTLNTLVDLVAVLHPSAPSTVGMLTQLFNSDIDDYEKPALVYVQTPDLAWHALRELSARPELSEQGIVNIVCSLQLADRAGPISRSLLQRFQSEVENIGLNLNAQVEWQNNTDPATDAVALDAFCIEVDKTMGFHLVHGEHGAFTGTKLRGLAEAHGLELAADGSFKYFDESNKKETADADPVRVPTFVMFNRDHYPFSAEMLRQSVVKGITFQLDIPHVANCTQAYNHMVQVARQMETGLHAQLVDDNNKPLSDTQIDRIRHQLNIIQTTMLTKGIVPGSAVAHRLFS